jgi:acyl-CoA reductase-like NAD-dependent aldehyde dehydrogenase
MRIARKETFGPFVTATRFERYEEAIEIVNELEYGLVCGIYARDMTKALRTVTEIDAGMAFISNHNRNAL